MKESEYPGEEFAYEQDIDSGGPSVSACQRRWRELLTRNLSEAQNPEHPLHDSLVQDPYTVEAIDWLAGNILTGSFFRHWENQEPGQRTRVSLLLRILRGFLDPNAPPQSFRDWVL
jgi:hypothetical protein